MHLGSSQVTAYSPKQRLTTPWILPKKVIRMHGRSASILTDKGVKVYDVKADDRLRGFAAFEKYFPKHNMKHVLSR